MRMGAGDIFKWIFFGNLALGMFFLMPFLFQKAGVCANRCCPA
jgi:hypothetical protein